MVHDPEKDPGVQRINEAKDDEEARRIEAELVLQTDNGLRPGDPEKQPK
jgi:hypothetical protein